MTEKSRAQEIAPHVARMLPGNWRYNRLESELPQNYRGSAILQNDDEPGKRFKILPYWQASGRLCFLGCHPNANDFSPFERTITVSAQRSADAIAREIARRFLPDYLTEYARKTAQVEERNARAADAANKINLVKKFLPETRPVQHSTERFHTRFGDIQLSWDQKEVLIRGHIPFDQFVAFIASLPPHAEDKK
ncbi:MAG: hypothetical protein JJ960_18760 [Kordiimonadaceae bacterium]|nr:hypothetical protein [Kordiimonadaceae bacterium]